MDENNLITSQIKQLRERNLDKYLHSKIDQFEDKFARLQQLLYLEPNNEVFQEAYELFYFIFDGVPLLVHTLTDVPIFRAQCNRLNELFSTQSRISYNKNRLDLIKPGKFNVWNQAVFYGSLPYQSVNENSYCPPSMTACLETCKNLSDKNVTTHMQDFTVGRWKIRHRFQAVNLCFDDVHLSQNVELQQTNKIFISNMTDFFCSRAGDFIKSIFQFFSSLCRSSSTDRAYCVLTALFVSIQTYYKVNDLGHIGALISPSAATEGTGLNIVISTQIVDKHLILDAVRMYRYFLIMPDANAYSIYPCSEMIENYKQISEFNFQFNEYIAPAQRFLKKVGLSSFS